MKKFLTFFVAFVIVAFIHEGTHALIAAAYGEFADFLVHPYGFEVVFRTPTIQRHGIQWGFISGSSSVLTVLLGYLLMFFVKPMAHMRNTFLSAVGYWLIMMLLLLDPLNLSVGPFLYGGDIGGIVAQVLLPAYGIKTDHPLFKPWFHFIGSEQ
ncbi:hypothetical protein [Coprothermobacter platensis]|uniref:hypothetical protein n=1 Tax=Coprothermobacter platensis TaxID=108819 RepID=UPI00035DCEE8|nr:hypothetical protein [Coprothermobacter platensis]